MAATRHKQRGKAADVARILGIHDSSVSRWQQNPDFPRPDSDGRFELAAVLEWYFLRKFATERDADLMQGSESEGLERYRLARAQQEEIKLAEQRGQIVRLNDFEPLCEAMLAPWRAVSEHFMRCGNDEVAAAIHEANAMVLANLERMYEPKA